MAFASSKIGAQEAIIKPCDLCEDDENVNWFCKDCDQNLCDRCKKTHLRSNVSKSHIVHSISEGFAMGKRNSSNICREHDELFTFFCKTCDRNICSQCLSAKHKKHDFVDMRELHSEVQKQLDDVIKEKETEKQMMTRNFDDLVQHEIQSEMQNKDECAKIKDRVRAIKVAADEEGEKLIESINSTKQQQDKEVKEGKHNIQTQTRVYATEIQSIQQELRLQTASSLHGFVTESMKKLKSLKPISIAIPDKQQLPFEGVEGNHIRETIGKLFGSQKVSVTENTEGRDGTKCNLFSNLEIIRTFNLDRIGRCWSMCLSPDGSIWIGGNGYVYKMSSDCSTVLNQITTRKSYSCSYIACLLSGDAVVSYGGVSHVDRFTSDRRRVEFTELSPKKTYDIAVNINDEVAISVDLRYIIIFSSKGKQLRKIEVDGGITTFCTYRDGHIIVAHRRSSNLTILDCRNGAVIKSWEVSISDITRLTCDRYGNVLATNMWKNIYFFSKNGDVQKTFTVDCDGINGICVNQDDHLLIVMVTKRKFEIKVTNYLE
ncbi:hypothetical protein FSP39_012883 [Pinctada imbricata]|uniref:B box-type domain-containing protein n=1 Tax=Pinctada imbricata TaxID=66713 RepID=A0AA88YPN0_PINIB|nr:hypothetical protein FSP39_004926 [Pinctada imbricata]KAK3104899.1 hypothetical protein FSP39_012883 [Pinctada imbricata]